jgi:DNA polymerase-3 subunit epsilon
LLEAGISVAVNLTGSVTDVVLASSAGSDPRLGRARLLGIQPLGAETLAPSSRPATVEAVDPLPPASALPAVAPGATAGSHRILVRGEMMELPAQSEWLVADGGQGRR